MIDLEAVEALAKDEASTTSEYLTYIEAMDLQTNDDLKFAVGAVAELKEYTEKVQDSRTGFVGPAQAIIDQANGLFKPALKDLKNCEHALKVNIKQFVCTQELRRNELLERVAAGEDVLEEADKCLIPKIAGLTFRRTSGFAVSDMSKALAWVVENGRDDLITLNLAAVKKAGLDIPGVDQVDTVTPSITASKVQRE